MTSTQILWPKCMQALLLPISRKQKRPTRNIKSWWRHQMEIFSVLLACYAGNSPVTSDSPHKGQWRGALLHCLIFTWNNSWANNWDADDLRRHRANYDVTVIGAPSCCRRYNVISPRTNGNIVATVRCTFSHIISNDNEKVSLTKIS